MKKNTTKKEEGLSVADTIKGIRAKFGADSIIKLDQKPISGVGAISTGSVGLNWALGIGGFPRGRIIEVYGPEASGKTTLALHTVAEAQKNGGTCAYIDAEHAMDPEYAKKIGVKTNDLFISQPNTGEEALQIVESLIVSKKFDVIVVDSVASLVPKEELEGEIGAQHIGRQARLMGQAMRKLTSAIDKSKAVVIFINQIRVSVNAFPGTNPEYTPGGKALKYASSVRVEIRRIATIKKGEESVGNRSRVKVVKNKVARPYRQAEFDLMFDEGISREGELLSLGSKHGVLSKTGNSYVFGTIPLGRGYDSSRVYLKENPGISDEIAKQITEKLNLKVETELEAEPDKQLE